MKNGQLYCNCSEATMRLNVTNLPDEMVGKILKALEEIKTENDAEHGNDGWWYDSWFGEEYLFGIRVVKISGDVPYNSQDKLRDALQQKVGVMRKETKSPVGFNTRVELLNGKTNETKLEVQEVDIMNLFDDADYSEP